MDPVAQTPTDPPHYAAISVLYGALLAALVLSTRDRDAEPVRATDLAVLGPAAFALSKTIAHEKVETWLRHPFVEELPDGEKRPKGRGLRYAMGELMSCPRCLGAWSALGLVTLRATSPTAGRTVSGILAVSATNDFLQAAFRLLCARQRGERRLRRARPAAPAARFRPCPRCASSATAASGSSRWPRPR